MEDCVFCKIRKGELPSSILYKDDDFMIIKDINPQAKIHLIAIPSEHVTHIDKFTDDGFCLIGNIIGKVSKLAPSLGLSNGYRLIVNQGDDGGQTVNHVHIHILGGEKLKDF